MLSIILLLCRGASVLFGLVAVYYSSKASTVTVIDADKRYDPRFDFVLNDPDDKADNINLITRMPNTVKRRFAYASLCRYCFGRPFISGGPPRFIRVIAFHALEPL